jgi:hypothetical protein
VLSRIAPTGSHRWGIALGTNRRSCHLGRTTFVNTLCGKPVLPHKDSDDATTAHVEEGVKIKPITVGKYSSP